MRANPKGLYGLLFAEFWERFSNFSVLSLFALYLNERLHLSEGRASALAGTFVALTYLTPLFGGWLADRALGVRRTLLAGSVVLGAGYAVLIHTSLAAAYWAVALLTLGSGLFKPNISTRLGNLFGRRRDPRRQAAFRALYLSVNVAAATAPIAIGSIQSRLGWSAAFGACTLSMLICLCAILWTHLTAPGGGAADSQTAVGTAAGGARALAVLCVPGIAFFAVFSQSLGTLIFWSRDRVDLTLGGWLATPLAPASTCAVIPIFAVALLPMIEPLRRLLGRLRLVRSVSGELGLALVLAALSILMLIIPEILTSRDIRLGAGWLIGSYVLLTVSELLLMPLSLSLVESIAPPRRGATYTGIYYLGVAAGSQLGSDLARLWGTLAAPRYFLLIAFIPLVAFGLLLTLRQYLDPTQDSR